MDVTLRGTRQQRRIDDPQLAQLTLEAPRTPAPWSSVFNFFLFLVKIKKGHRIRNSREWVGEGEMKE